MATAQSASGNRALSRAAGLWFITATIGQWAFVYFIMAFYGRHSIDGNFALLNNKPNITGYVPGDSIGNIQWLMHVFLAAIVTFSGVLQLIPAIRQRLPSLHRWNGRLFLITALIATLTGFYLTWIRGSQLNLPSALSTSLNGVFIIVFACLAWRSALQRDFAEHRRHALRAYLLVNGVWFLRIGIILTGIVLSAFGIEMSYESPAFLAVSFLSWIVPIALLQLFFSAQASSNMKYQYRVAGVFIFLSLLTLGGSILTMMFMWWPYL
jgi:Predicted membrane protein (DUF2306)